MRTFLIALFVVSTGVMAAQPVVTPEIATGPYAIGMSPLSTEAPPVALARDKHGVAIAWSAQKRIHVARLDQAGHIDGEIRVLPIRSKNATAEAHQPSLAATPANEGFVVAWIETGRTLPVGVFAFLDRDLTASTPAFLPTNEVKSILVRTGATKMWIAAERELWEVERDGTVRPSFTAKAAARGLAVVGDTPTVLVREYAFTRCTCAGTGGVLSVCPESCKAFNETVQLRLEQPYAAIDARTLRFETHAEVALAADGGQLLIAWMNGRQQDGGEVVLSKLSASEPAAFPTAIETPVPIGRFAWDSGPTRPDIATNGKRRVVVWRNRVGERNYDIVGASIDEKGAITHFNVATTDANEHDPSVLALPNGNFLVAYDKGSDGKRVVAWRYLLFEGRRRAVR